MKLRLQSIKPEVENVESFIFEPEQPITWQAGQYLHYVLSHPDADDRGVERWFTVAAPPFQKMPMITTRFTDPKGSTFKRALKVLKIGDTVEADGPKGDFIITDPSKKYVFIAGGIGITPFHSILLQLDHDKAPINVDLLYANKNDQKVFGDELEQLANRQPNFKIHDYIDPKRIEEQDIRALDNSSEAIYYISGPRPLVEAYEHMLRKMGMADEQIKTDYFPGY